MLDGAADAGRFDAVVIGSGFGGAVAASRLVEDPAGLDVLMLERGLPYPPGSFPRTPREMRRSFWSPDSGQHGLYDAWLFRNAGALVASGLGGGSLIYANVLLRKPPETFGADSPNGWLSWPVGADDLEEHYDAVEAVLQPVPVPDSYEIPKLRHFRRAARAAGLDPEPAPLAVTFEADGRVGQRIPLDEANLHHRLRHTCVLKGECNVGCNEGAKNSLDYTYLTRFVSQGGRIRTCCEAVKIESVGVDGYRVRYVEHAAARRVVQRRAADECKESDLLLLDEQGPGSGEEPESWVRSVRAKVVVLAAGALGSTKLLLASRRTLPRLSPRLGHRFCLNGDLISFARDCKDETEGVQRDLNPSVGPVITSVARVKSGAREMWIQDAGGPEFSEWLWQGTENPRHLAAAAMAIRRARSGGSVGGALSRFFGSTAASSSMLPLLIMGRDAGVGRLRLEEDGLALDLEVDALAGYFDDAQALASKLVMHLGGRVWPRTRFGRHLGVTVHPLGGCPMGDRSGNGVVDARGEAYNAPGLFVADGSIMPGPIGPNPSLTIAALAHRIGAAAASRAAGTAAATPHGAAGRV